jgi:glyoxylase-like metal-dependent hydrolase (beta-lactamase superfamily II)
MSGVPRYRIGNAELTVVSDGTVHLDAGAVFGLVPRVLWEPIAGHPNAKNQLTLGLNCLVVRTGEQVVLVETGMGNKVPQKVRETSFPGDYGYLLDNLAKLGIRPEDVDIVINTHLHADHCGWNTAQPEGAEDLGGRPEGVRSGARCQKRVRRRRGGERSCC